MIRRLLTYLMPTAVLSDSYHVAGPGLRTEGAGCCNWGYSFNIERHSVAFGGSHVGTHASHSAYGLGSVDRDIAWWNMTENVKPLAVSTPWWQSSVPNTAFGNLIHVRCPLLQPGCLAAWRVLHVFGR